jgi:hypothetical protein
MVLVLVRFVTRGYSSGLLFPLGDSFAVALCIFFINMFVFLPLAFSFRCPHCDGFVLVQDWRTLQRAQKRVLAVLGLASWVAVVFDIVLHHEFTCMHCAERCLVKVNTDTANSLARHDD